MLENEMEDLLWAYPEKFLNEPLKPFKRQPRSVVGRADLVFEDRLGRLLVVEIKRGQLQRGAIPQVIDYFGMMKRQFPEKAVEMMVIAQSVPPERQLALGQFNVEYREISEKRFRDVAREVKYIFRSEGEAPPSASAISETTTIRANERVMGESSAKELRATVAAVVNAYNLNADPDLRVRDGQDPSYRQIVPPPWKVSYIHYEFRQTNKVIGAELHLNRAEVVSIAEFLKPLHGRAVAGGEGTLTWDGDWKSGKGRLAAFFPLGTAPETVAAAMRDLISMTRSGISALLPA